MAAMTYATPHMLLASAVRVAGIPGGLLLSLPLLGKHRVKLDNRVKLLNMSSAVDFPSALTQVIFASEEGQ